MYLRGIGQMMYLVHGTLSLDQKQRGSERQYRPLQTVISDVSEFQKSMKFRCAGCEEPLSAQHLKGELDDDSEMNFIILIYTDEEVLAVLLLEMQQMEFGDGFQFRPDPDNRALRRALILTQLHSDISL